MKLLELYLLLSDHTQQSINLSLLFRFEFLVQLPETRCSAVVRISSNQEGRMSHEQGRMCYGRWVARTLSGVANHFTRGGNSGVVELNVMEDLRTAAVGSRGGAVADDGGAI